MTARKPVVVALSGLDGSGKSSQSTGVADRLREAGHGVRVHWMALGHSTVQRRLRRLASGARNRSGRSAARPGAPVLEVDGVTKHRAARHPLVTHAWVLLLAVVYGLHFRRTARRCAEEVVIFDRYTLDAIAQSRYFYDPDRSFRAARWLLRLLAPTPQLSYLLDVPPEVALARKQEQYDAAQLRLQSRLLMEEASHLNVRVLDGTRPADELTEELVAQTLAAIRGRP